MKKNILIISYYFPPMGMGGVQRMAKLAKYLLNFGYNVSVLTIKEVNYPAHDKSLLDELPKDINIYRAGSYDPSRIARVLRLPVKTSPSAAARLKNKGLIWPDSKSGWKEPASRLARKIIKNENTDIILSSSPPITGHVLAMRLCDEFGLPWIADFRDIWESFAPEYLYDDEALIKKSNDLLKDIKNKASAVTTINKTIGSRLSDDSNIFMGGFDEDDFKDLEYPFDDEHFTLCYMGSVEPLHPIEQFFQAAKIASNKNRRFEDKLRFWFIGANDDKSLYKLANKYYLGDKVKSYGYLPHREALARAAGSDVLLLSAALGHNDILTGKIFDYFGLPQPILAAAPLGGEAALLIKKHNGGIVASPDDIDGLAEAMLDLFNKREHNEKWAKSNLDKLSRKETARQFAELIERYCQ